MDADDAQAECSCIISSTSPSGKAAYCRPFHQVTWLMLLISHVWVQVETICGVTVASLSGLSYFILFRHTLFSWVHGNHAYHTIRHVLLTCQFEGFKIPHCFLFKDARTSLFFDCWRRPIVAPITGVRHEWTERQGWVGHYYRRCVLLRDRGITFLPAYKGKTIFHNHICAWQGGYITLLCSVVRHSNWSLPKFLEIWV